jgi:hypothetical protein
MFGTVLIKAQKNAIVAKSVAVLKNYFKEYRVKAEDKGNVAEKQQYCSIKKIDRMV